MALFDSFSPHATHNGHGATGSPVKEKPNDRYVSLYSLELTVFAFFWTTLVVGSSTRIGYGGSLIRSGLFSFSNIYPCLRCVRPTCLYINLFICNLLFAYLSINCAAYRHQQAYGSIYVAYHQQRDHAHSARTGLHIVQYLFILTNEVNLHHFSRHTCPSLMARQCAAAVSTAPEDTQRPPRCPPCGGRIYQRPHTHAHTHTHTRLINQSNRLSTTISGLITFYLISVCI